MSSLQPLRSTRINEQVYEAIQGAIVRCELEPGSMIGDRQLAEDLQVSRTPVRDALHRLESTGLVERRKPGWLVTNVSTTDLSELFDTRCLLESAGLERLFQRWSEEARRVLAATFDDFYGRLSDERVDEYLEADNRFHASIVGASENSRIVGFYETIERQVHRGRHYLSYGLEGRVYASLEEHRTICAALIEGDVSATTEALLEHLHNADAAMHEMFRKRQLESPGREEVD